MSIDPRLSLAQEQAAADVHKAAVPLAQNDVMSGTDSSGTGTFSCGWPTCQLTIEDESKLEAGPIKELLPRSGPGPRSSPNLPVGAGGTESAGARSLETNETTPIELGTTHSPTKHDFREVAEDAAHLAQRIGLGGSFAAREEPIALVVLVDVVLQQSESPPLNDNDAGNTSGKSSSASAGEKMALAGEKMTEAATDAREAGRLTVEAAVLVKESAQMKASATSASIQAAAHTISEKTANVVEKIVSTSAAACEALKSAEAAAYDNTISINEKIADTVAAVKVKVYEATASREEKPHLAVAEEPPECDTGSAACVCDVCDVSEKTVRVAADNDSAEELEHP